MNDDNQSASIKSEKLISSNTMSRSGASFEGSETMIISNSSPLYMLDQATHLSSAYFICLLGPAELVGKYWAISDKKKMSIGRSRKCDIPIQELSISKKHLCVRVDQKNKTLVEDQASTNKTSINDQVIDAKKEIVLQDNSKIKLGSIVLKFLDRGNPEILSVTESFERSFRDSLTGIGNKLMLKERANELFQQSKQFKIPLSLIIFDIDHFKKVNDTYGHLAGDFILKEVVRLVASCFRSGDVLARCGGEEFCVVMKSLVDRAENAIELARQKLEAHLFQYKEHKIKVTISAGVTNQRETDKSWLEMYERADKLLYKAKNTGRNKIFSRI